MVTTMNRQSSLLPTKIHIEEINKTNGVTSRVAGIKKRYLDATPTMASDRAWYFAESYKLTEGEHPALRAAKAFRNLMEKMPILIREGELLVGMTTPHERGAHPRLEMNPRGFLLRLEKPTTGSAACAANVLPEDKERLIAACNYWISYWDARREDRPLIPTNEQGLNVARETELAPGGMIVGLVPGADFRRVINKGLKDFIARARQHIETIRGKTRFEYTEEDVDKIENLEAMIIAMEGLIAFSRRHAALAREMAAKETDPQRKKELLKIADVCENVPANPARDFQEALQACWLVTVGHDVEKATTNAYIGRVDQYCWPLYEKDIREGRITRQEAAELMGCMFMKWTGLEPFMFDRQQELATSNYIANVTVGGITREGRDASNELSCLVLHVAKQIRTHQPHVSVRWHRAIAPELLDKAIECARDHGAGIPAFFNDRIGIDYLLDRGIPMEEARDWAVAGCINIAVPTSFCFNRGGGTNFINHAKMLELALNDGVDPRTGAKIGPATGESRNFKDFEEVVEAYLSQLDYIYEVAFNKFRGMKKQMMASFAYIPFISSLMDDCIERGKDANHGGERYEDQLEGAACIDRAIQDACDSMLAIKKVVFEGGVPMSTLLDGLKANWVGYDDLRQRCVAAPKYGNDDDEADSLMYRLWRYGIDKTMSFRDWKGRRPIAYRQGAAWAQFAGRVTGALPNGRKAYTSLADASASPCHGADVKGPTAVLNSVAKMDTMYLEGPLLNMKFAPGPLRTREGRMKFGELITTFFDKGGYHVQFTILDRDTLLDAKKHPQKYRNLVVRVAGYSAFWVELTPDIQDEIISRTEHQL